MLNELVDVKENTILELDIELLNILLKDHSSEKNIIWGTDNYEEFNYHFGDEITVEKITANNSNIIKPRIKKNRTERDKRSKEKAEVFTPSWICNIQNNICDEKLLGYSNPFNYGNIESWTTNTEKIIFNMLSWQDYVNCLRLEITCGEAPYLVSRYDTVSGEIIDIERRIGILDRKIRVINENVTSDSDWLVWVENAYKSTYGYEWQGDSLLIARENLLYTYIDYYYDRFNKKPGLDKLISIANIISWNIFQMDGLKGVIPDSCKNETIIDYTLFGEEIILKECDGCKNNRINKHNGKYAYIMDWNNNKKVKFISIMKDRK